jgi:hypothetical protein
MLDCPMLRLDFHVVWALRRLFLQLPRELRHIRARLIDMRIVFVCPVLGLAQHSRVRAKNLQALRAPPDRFARALV